LKPLSDRKLLDVKPPDESHRTAMFKNARLRLLMSLIGFEKVGVEDIPEASWIVPSLAEADLRDIKSIIENKLENPLNEDDGVDPRKQLRRKRVASSPADHYTDINFGSDSEGEDDVPDGPLFPPNPRSKANALDKLKKNRRKRRQKDEDDEDDESLDDAQLEERRRNRQANALARQAKIKSDLYIHASDDDTDEDGDRDFFLQEEERRKTQAERIRQELLASVSDGAPKKNAQSKKRRKRQSAGDDLEGLEMESKKRRQMNVIDLESGDDGEDDILMVDTKQSPGSQEQTLASHENSDHGTLTSDDDFDVDDKSRNYENLAPIDDKGEIGHVSHEVAAAVGSDDDDAPVMSSRRRIRGGFVVDSDSE
jgi:replication fork protection complex subunit Tof1/Swi1